MDTAVSSGSLELTLERVLAIWWAFVWRATLLTVLVGAFLGLVGGVIVGASGHPELGGTVGALLGWMGGIPVSIFVLRAILLKRFSGFSIRLVSSSQ